MDSYEAMTARSKIFYHVKAYKCQVLDAVESHVRDMMDGHPFLKDSNISRSTLVQHFDRQFSPENFLNCWVYIQGYVDISGSSTLANYYLKSELFPFICMGVVLLVYRVTEQRVLFRCGDFIRTKYDRYHNDSIARISHTFTHEVVAGSRRLFLDVTPIIPSQPPRNDELLAVPVLKVAGESDIVGLPAVEGTRLYVLPFIEQDGNGMELSMGKMSIDLESEDKVLCVNWNIQFL
ncbi:hypothetical protein LPUS_05324 [Lasallia pustulata]|uniref:Uncharacterized protein n=1 Tax=Lasallia pustulata TaxID=136370 RepID=A0A1W5CYG6_9LECA|nr:hypothetical protein LPUS_05324 [Lasallia pustulata]